MARERARAARRSATVSSEPVRLHFTADAAAGYRRLRARGGFRYVDRQGKPVRDAAELTRIQAIAVPPAWDGVWISTDPVCYLQATGRDARGRKQYRYHPQFRRRRDAQKFAHLVEFGRALPRIRRRVRRDLARRQLDREHVLAAVVSLLERTFVRVGNEEYARANRSFGLTTLRTRHVDIDGSEIRFRFYGKSGQLHDVGLRDRRLAGIVRRIREVPGQRLFQYLDADGRPHDVESEDVNGYLREAAGNDVTAKDFRTWAGTLLAFRALRATRSSTGHRARGALTASTEVVAEALGNTPAVTRASYIAPRVVDAYLDGDLPDALSRAGEETDRVPTDIDRREELALIHLLETKATGVHRSRGAIRGAGEAGTLGRHGAAASSDRTRRHQRVGAG